MPSTAPPTDTLHCSRKTPPAPSALSSDATLCPSRRRRRRRRTRTPPSPPLPASHLTPPCSAPNRSKQMENRLADELYSEILKPKVELDQTSVDQIRQSHSVDCEDEQWCEDGSSWNDSDGKFDPSSDLDREWQRRKNQFHAIGYRDGLIAGKEASAQEGFNVGFKESVVVGYNWGLVRGVTGALNCLPSELREKIIKSEETRNKFHHLHESVNNLSTTDSLKVFHDDLLKQRTKQEQNSDVGILDSYYGQLQSLLLESPEIKMQKRDNLAPN